MTHLAALAASLAAHFNLRARCDIDLACAALGLGQASPRRAGDDAAAIPYGDGWQLMATGGFMNAFVAAAPWFARWCAVMVNMPDIAAMGGRATAVTKPLWAPDAEAAAEILRGMKDASAAYCVPLLGGQTNLRTDRVQLAASIFGQARALIISFHARPGDVLIVAIDHRGVHAGDSDISRRLPTPRRSGCGSISNASRRWPRPASSPPARISARGGRRRADAGRMLRRRDRDRAGCDPVAAFRAARPLDDHLPQLRFPVDCPRRERRRGVRAFH